MIGSDTGSHRDSHSNSHCEGTLPSPPQGLLLPFYTILKVHRLWGPFLKLYERTRDAKWLGRARAFAMHAIGQYWRLKSQHGQGWYTLWTGDLGFAVYLWQCISEDSGFPTADFF